MLGLLHDAAEAFLSDVPSPWKPHLLFRIDGGEAISFREAEARVQAAVFAALRVRESEAAWKQVKLADSVLLAAEAASLMPHSTIPFPDGHTHDPVEPWGPKRAEAEFLARYYQLAGEAG